MIMKIAKYNEFKNISGNKLRELRKESKMSQQVLAEKLQLEVIDLTSNYWFILKFFFISTIISFPKYLLIKKIIKIKSSNINYNNPI